MKVLFTTLLAIFSFVTSAQQQGAFYKMDMAVMFVDSSITYRFEKARIVWGAVGDTLCFSLETERYFYPINKKHLTKKGRDKVIRLNALIDLKKEEKEKHFLLQDYRNQIYHIRFINNDRNGHLLIYITNVNAGFPSYCLSRVK